MEDVGFYFNLMVLEGYVDYIKCRIFGLCRLKIVWYLLKFLISVGMLFCFFWLISLVIFKVMFGW